MKIRFCDEFEHGVGWTPDDALQRTSHALVVDGDVWLTDPVAGEGVEERVRALGEPVGVIQLIDRHNRDGEQLARRLGVPLRETPFAGIPGSPFEVVPLVRRPWKEIALWWPEHRVLVCADALATLAGYRAPGEALAVHPLMRLTPPRALARFAPEHILVGHGEGIHGAGAPEALRRALAGSRRRVPSLVANTIGKRLPRRLRPRG